MFPPPSSTPPLNRLSSQKRLSQDDLEDENPQSTKRQCLPDCHKENTQQPSNKMLLPVLTSPRSSKPTSFSSPTSPNAMRLSRSASFMHQKSESSFSLNFNKIPQAPPTTDQDASSTNFFDTPNSPYSCRLARSANPRLQRAQSNPPKPEFLQPHIPAISVTPETLEYRQKLPMKNSHKGQNTIESSTLSSLLAPNGIHGLYNTLRILDCRYPYEFEGGHIIGAENWPVLEDLVIDISKKMDSMTLSDGPDICLIIHCEFSSERGPNAYRKIRELDRRRNFTVESFGQKIFFPEMYILEGGYSAFFQTNAFLCQPKAYVKMKNPAFQDDYRAAYRMAGVGKNSWLSKSCPNLNLTVEGMELDSLTLKPNTNDHEKADSPRTTFAARLKNIHLEDSPQNSPQKQRKELTLKSGIRSRSWEKTTFRVPRVPQIQIVPELLQPQEQQNYLFLPALPATPTEQQQQRNGLSFHIPDYMSQVDK